MFRNLSSFHHHEIRFFSKFQLEAELNLPRIEDFARRTEAGDRSHAQNAVPVERVEVPDIYPVEQIEEIKVEFTVQSFRQFDRSRDPRIDRGIAWPHQRVATEIPWSIRERVAVIVGVESGKDRVGSPALDRHQRTEFEITQEGHALRHLLEKREREPMRQMLA